VIGASLGMGCGVRGKRVEVSGRTAEGLAVAMTELALNAYKHGYGGAAGDGIEVRVAAAPGGWVRLTVRDWGAGWPRRRARSRPPGGERRDGAGAGLGARRRGRAARRPRPAPRRLGDRDAGRADDALTDGGAHVVIEVPQS
jgi:hypothetical protein